MVIKNSNYHKLEILLPFISENYYKNIIIYNHDIYEFITLPFKTNINKNYTYNQDINCSNFNLPKGCENFINSFTKVDYDKMIGFGTNNLYLIFLEFEDKMELWIFSYNEEYSESSLIGTIKTTKDYENLSKEISIIGDIDANFWDMNQKFYDVTIFLNKFIKKLELSELKEFNIIDQKLPELPEFEKLNIIDEQLPEFDQKCKEFNITDEQFKILVSLHNKKIGF